MLALDFAKVRSGVGIISQSKEQKSFCIVQYGLLLIGVGHYVLILQSCCEVDAWYQSVSSRPWRGNVVGIVRLRMAESFESLLTPFLLCCPDDASILLSCFLPSELLRMLTSFV